MKTKIAVLSIAVSSVIWGIATTHAAPLNLNSEIPALAQATRSNAWLEVNLAQFKSNFHQFSEQIKAGTKVCMVMKADAYGNGILGLMPAVLELGVECIAVASNGEAKQVRDSGFTGQLIRVRSANIHEIQAATQFDIEELVGSVAQANAISDLNLGKPIKVHLALNDGGMSRNGLDMSNQQGKEEVLNLADNSDIKVVGIMTHFPNYDADEVKAKLNSFTENTDWLFANSAIKRDDVMLHVANSYASLNVPESQLDMVRPGGVIYGDLPTNPEFPSIVSFKTRVASLHNVPKNTPVGYDSSFVTQKDSVLANLPVGYSDGYPRKMGNRAWVVVNGQRAPVVGKTSMNTTMVDVTQVKGVLAGQEVVLFGQQSGQAVTVGEMEEHSELIFPELYTLWGLANPRIYLQ